VGRRSEEGLTENTQWAQWSVCSAIRCAIECHSDAVYTDNGVAGTHGRIPV